MRGEEYESEIIRDEGQEEIMSMEEEKLVPTSTLPDPPDEETSYLPESPLEECNGHM